MAGEILNIRNGAIFTMVEEWSKALTGVGATIAPNNQLLNGICGVTLHDYFQRLIELGKIGLDAVADTEIGVA